MQVSVETVEKSLFFTVSERCRLDYIPVATDRNTKRTSALIYRKKIHAIHQTCKLKNKKNH